MTDSTIKISVSGSNYRKLISAMPGTKVIISHVGNHTEVELQKTKTIIPKKKMTIKQIEKALGFEVELIR